MGEEALVHCGHSQRSITGLRWENKDTGITSTHFAIIGSYAVSQTIMARGYNIRNLSEIALFSNSPTTVVLLKSAEHFAGAAVPQMLV